MGASLLWSCDDRLECPRSSVRLATRACHVPSQSPIALALTPYGRLVTITGWQHRTALQPSLELWVREHQKDRARRGNANRWARCIRALCDRRPRVAKRFGTTRGRVRDVSAFLNFRDANRQYIALCPGRRRYHLLLALARIDVPVAGCLEHRDTAINIAELHGHTIHPLAERGHFEHRRARRWGFRCGTSCCRLFAPSVMFGSIHRCRLLETVAAAVENTTPIGWTVRTSCNGGSARLNALRLAIPATPCLCNACRKPFRYKPTYVRARGKGSLLSPHTVSEQTV